MLRALFGNWEGKLLALGIAVFVWFLVVNADHRQLAFAAPVEYVGVPAGMVLVGDRRESVDVQVDAARWAVARLTPAAVRVRIDLTGLKPGDNSVPVSPTEVDTPVGVVVTRISPAWIRVRLAEAMTRSVRVVPHVVGTPAPGHAISKVEVAPSAIELKGPRSTMDAEDVVETLPVDVAGGAAPVTQRVGLVLPDAVYPTARGTVRVTVDILPEDQVRQRRSGGPRR